MWLLETSVVVIFGMQLLRLRSAIRRLDVILHRGWFWAKSAASGSVSWCCFGSCWTVLSHLMWGRPSCLLHCCKFTARLSAAIANAGIVFSCCLCVFLFVNKPKTGWPPYKFLYDKRNASMRFIVYIICSNCMCPLSGDRHLGVGATDRHSSYSYSFI